MRRKHPRKGIAGEYREPIRDLDPLLHALRQRRYNLGLSIGALAEVMGYDQQTVAGWETGRRPSFCSLMDWAAALECELTIEPREDRK